ncbi:MAG: hypothetical protein WKF36_10005 [Candidatus Nitrosocosmicus sp.]
MCDNLWQGFKEDLIFVFGYGKLKQEEFQASTMMLNRPAREHQG